MIMASGNFTGNSTDSHSVWSSTVVSQITFSVLTVVLNVGMIICFVLEKKLHTSFSVYLIYLLLSNIVHALTQYPLSVFQELSSPTPMRRSVCTLFKYSGTAIGCFTKYSHLLITVNRIWALTCPFSYKNHHSKKIAVLLCMSSVCYVNVTILPGLLLDAFSYGLPEKLGCMFNGEKLYVWLIFMQVILLDLPVVFIILAYPILLHKESARRRTIGMTGGPTSVAKRAVTFVEETEGYEGSTTRRPKQENKRNGQAFTILTLLTASVFVCWTPNLAFWTVANLTGVYDSAADHATATLLAFQTVLDPILFAFSLGIFQRLFRKAKCRQRARLG